LDVRHAAGRNLSRRGRGAGGGHGRRPLPRGRRPGALLHRARRAPGGFVRAIVKRSETRWAIATLGAFVVLGLLPLAVRREDILNFFFLVLLSITIAESWNVVAGYAGQVNLGHAAFFGLGALTTRTLWLGGTPLVVAMIAGAGVATAVALAVGVAAFRLRGAYFAIGTLALGEISRITAGNVLPEI